jgi:pyridoxamine-phosphate oxidase
MSTAGEIGLKRADLDADPFRQFQNWFQQVAESGILEPNAMSLATVSASGQPSLRTVLLKLYDERGFVFFTNYSSRKAQDIASNPRVAVLFFWAALGRQVKITGTAAKIPLVESMEYFATRPRGSQLGLRQSSTRWRASLRTGIFHCHHFGVAIELYPSPSNSGRQGNTACMIDSSILMMKPTTGI